MSNSYFSGKFGLERETLRVDRNGRLAQTPHPFGNDENITRDFCENQTELVTPVCNSIDEALDALARLDRRLNEQLSARGERVWLYSNPPRFESEDEIPIADFTGDHSSKRRYREALERKYGRRLMLFSGIHFNFSFPEEFLSVLNTAGEDAQTFRSRLYLRLYKQLMCYSWLLVLLTAASPYYDASLDKDGENGIIFSKYTSMRNSSRGYWNKFVPILDHESLEAFTRSIGSLISSGKLYSASELYLPVRLKPRGTNTLEALARNGVDHIELRMFDLDPSEPLGICSNDLRFAHLLMLYLITLPDIDFTPELQEKAVRDHKQAALREANEELYERAESLLNDMEKHFAGSSTALSTLASARAKLWRRRTASSFEYINIYE